MHTDDNVCNEFGLESLHGNLLGLMKLVNHMRNVLVNRNNVLRTNNVRKIVAEVHGWHYACSPMSTIAFLLLLHLTCHNQAKLSHC